MVCLLLVLTATALLLRVAYLQQTKIDRPIRADARQYYHYGWNLWRHRTFSPTSPEEHPVPDSNRSPGYPLLIAAALWIGGEQNYYEIVRYAQAVIGALMVPATFLLGRTFLPRWAALAAAALVALSPHLVSMCSYLLTETLFGLLLLTCFLVLGVGIRRKSVAILGGAGICFGGAYLVNQTAGMLPIIFAGALALGGRFAEDRRRYPPMRGLALFLIVFSVFPAAWMVRDYAVLQPDARRGSDRLLKTMSHGTYPGFVFKDPKWRYFPYRDDPEQPKFGESMDDFARVFWPRFRERPGRYLRWYLLEKPYVLWTWNILQGQGDVYVYPVHYSLYDRNALAGLTHGAMKRAHAVVLVFTLLAFIAYLWQGWTSRRGTHHRVEAPGLLLLTLAAYSIFYAIVAPWPRYAVPLRPQLYLCAVWGLVTLLQATHLLRPFGPDPPVDERASAQ